MRGLTYRALVLSGILITVGLVGVLLAYGQLLMRPPEKASPVPFNTIYYAAGAEGYSRPANLVIENESSWSTVWHTALCNQDHCPPLPEINFTDRTVIAAFYGFGADANSILVIDKVTRTASTVTVHVTFVVGGNCAAPLIVVHWGHIIDIPKTDLQVKFSKTSVPSNC